MTCNSSIYECTVMHRRLAPKIHQFSYNVFYLWLDLDELESLSKQLHFFKHNRWSLFSFFDSDHLDKKEGSAKANVLKLLSEEGIDTTPIASIRMLTFPRVLGYIFNPVCFYYCFDDAGKTVCAVAEVTNTYHEQKPYVLNNQEAEDRLRLITPKHFYVSPFFDLDLLFDFNLRVPKEHLEIHIDDRDGEKRVLLTSLTGKRRELSDTALLSCAFKYPLLTLKVIFLIHWQALRLWLKRLPAHSKAAQPELQRGVYKPHRSIAPTLP